MFSALKRFFLFTACSLLCLETRAAEPLFSRNIAKSRVVIAADSEATIAFQPKPEKVRAVVNSGLLQLTGKTNAAAAWRTFISTNDIVGIKVYSAPGSRSGTRPDVAAAVIEGLLSAGISTNHIVIWDKELSHLRLAGFDALATRYHVKLAASASAGYDLDTFYESPLIGNLIWGDVEFGKSGGEVGRKSFVTKLVAREITKIISIAPLLNHNIAGTTGHLCSLALGSVDNTQRFEQPDRLATALPEIFALPSLADKVVLNITDALICQYQGEQRSLLHYSAPLNQIWFSKDPVALDVLAIHELDRQRNAANIPTKKMNLDIYENASLLELGISDLKSIQIDNAQ